MVTRPTSRVRVIGAVAARRVGECRTDQNPGPDPRRVRWQGVRCRTAHYAPGGRSRARRSRRRREDGECDIDHRLCQWIAEQSREHPTDTRVDQADDDVDDDQETEGGPASSLGEVVRPTERLRAAFVLEEHRGHPHRPRDRQDHYEDDCADQHDYPDEGSECVEHRHQDDQGDHRRDHYAGKAEPIEDAADDEWADLGPGEAKRVLPIGGSSQGVVGDGLHYSRRGEQRADRGDNRQKNGGPQEAHDHACLDGFGVDQARLWIDRQVISEKPADQRRQDLQRDDNDRDDRDQDREVRLVHLERGADLVAKIKRAKVECHTATLGRS